MKKTVLQVLKQNQNVMVYTQTHYFMGRVKEVEPGWCLLEKAVWIAVQGRMTESLLEGPDKLSAHEPMPDDVLIALDAVVAVTPWRHDLPTKVK